MFMTKFFDSVATLRGKEKNRRAFILGNGPSITIENLDLLRDELVIGINASTMLEKQYKFVTDYYVVSDLRFLNNIEKRQWATTELNPKTIRVFRSDLREIDDPLYMARTHYVRALQRDGFSHDLAVGFYYACTTTMLAIQLANHLGCSEIYLLGVDLRYASEAPRFYSEKNPQLEDSYTSVQIYNISNAARVLEEKGSSLISCSNDSFLRPYIKYQSFQSIFY